MQTRSNNFSKVLHNIIIGLTVSFVALSLGAALGIFSGRGAYAGMFSAGLIALITSLLGGTRIQCSGPTAPMSAISAVVVAFAYEQGFAFGAPHLFINMVFILTGALLVIMGLLRLGKFITLVPEVVVSGFMNGIALLIWVGQICVLFGWGGREQIDGSLTANVSVALGTLVLIFIFPIFAKKLFPKFAHFIPATLVAIAVLSTVAAFLELNVSYVGVFDTLTSFNDLAVMVSSQWPTDWSTTNLKAAFPLALQLALLCYLDTLLTSLVVDKINLEKTAQNKELVAQGIANAAVACVGGIPGAQATIRSVLILKEGATMRLAGIFCGYLCNGRDVFIPRPDVLYSSGRIHWDLV